MRLLVRGGANVVMPLATCGMGARSSPISVQSVAPSAGGSGRVGWSQPRMYTSSSGLVMSEPKTDSSSPLRSEGRSRRSCLASA